MTESIVECSHHVKLKENHRLPTNVIPLHYDLNFVVNFEERKLTGTTSIQLSIKEKTKSISLHTLILNISLITLKYHVRPIQISYFIVI
jgi:aminopeptidase N